MTTSATRGLILSALSLMLAACGGGGGSSSSKPVAATSNYPTSGPYAWTYTVANTTTSPEFGIAFAHSSKPTTSFIVEAASSQISDVLEIDRGTVDATTGGVTALTPSQLIYVADGTLKQVALVANGTAPTGTAAPNADANVYCKFTVSSIDYATPSNSRIVVSTAGPDKTCGTSDDGAVIYTFSSTGTLTQSGGSYAAGKVLAPLASVRASGTYAPAGWFDSQGVDVGGTESVLYPSGAAVAMVSSSPFAALVTVNSALHVTTTALSGSAPATVAVPVPACAWAGIGFDGASFYTYCNTTSAGTYAIYQVPYAGTTATMLASGSGTVETASLGAASVYATVFDNSTYSELAINKSTTVLTTLVASTTVSPAVFSTSTGTDFLWQATVSGTFATSITVLSPALATVTSYSAGFPSGYVAPSSINLNLSENRTQFLFFNGYTSPGGASGATLMNYNTGNAVATAIGVIPTAATLGGSTVLFIPGGGGGSNFLVGFAEAAAGTTFESQNSKAYTFAPDTASSLNATAPL